MATINFLYRSKKPNASLNVRFLHTSKEGTVLQLGAKTKLVVSQDYWKNVHTRPRIKDIDLKDLQTEIRNELLEIEKFILTSFTKVLEGNIDKEWLKKVMSRYYDGSRTEDGAVPFDLVNYGRYYISLRKREWNSKTLQAHSTTVNKLERLQHHLGETILLENVDHTFKEDYISYCLEHSYSPNTMSREMGRIKEYLNHAKNGGLKVYNHFKSLSVSGEDSDSVFLTPDELNVLKKMNFKNERLSNTRDLLLVACFTGQRVSDFMRFKKSMIRNQGEAKFLEFQQKKPPKKRMSIPLTHELQELLNERGDFPRGITEQNFNLYVKEVCDLAGFNELVPGSKRVNITPEEDKATMRTVKGIYPKSQLVSSHVGRRSFASNYFGKIPTTYLMFITGHSRESTFLSYIKKSNTDLAIEAYRLFQIKDIHTQ